MGERQVFGLEPGDAGLYLLIGFVFVFVSIWMVATLDPDQIYSRGIVLGDGGVLFVRLIMLFPGIIR